MGRRCPSDRRGRICRRCRSRPAGTAPGEAGRRTSDRSSMAKVAASHLTPDPKRIDLGLSPAQVGFAKFESDVYLSGMPKSAFEPCIPTPGKAVPDRPEWIHEIKHDGYRLIVQRDGKRVRLWTRNGHDWSGRFPLITEAALRNRIGAFVIDGEAVLLGVDARSDCDGLHSRKHNEKVQFYAFDMLVADGEDIRKLPLSMRKARLTRLLARRVMASS